MPTDLFIVCDCDLCAEPGSTPLLNRPVIDAFEDRECGCLWYYRGDNGHYERFVDPGCEHPEDAEVVSGGYPPLRGYVRYAERHGTH